MFHNHFPAKCPEMFPLMKIKADPPPPLPCRGEVGGEGWMKA